MNPLWMVHGPRLTPWRVEVPRVSDHPYLVHSYLYLQVKSEVVLSYISLTSINPLVLFERRTLPPSTRPEISYTSLTVPFLFIPLPKVVSVPVPFFLSGHTHPRVGSLVNSIPSPQCDVLCLSRQSPVLEAWGRCISGVRTFLSLVVREEEERRQP